MAGGMISALGIVADAALRAALSPAVTSVTEGTYHVSDYRLLNGRDPESRTLGIEHVRGPDFVLAVTDPARPVGAVRIETHRPGVLLLFDNRAWRGTLHASLRVLGAGSALIFHDVGDGFVMLDAFLRSDRQVLFWGIGATAVGCNIELQGDGALVAIGDDALISNGVWLRNHDMHALHDIASGAPIGRAPVSMVLERHVWLGQDALLLGCPRIGMGAARALVKREVPRCVSVGGVPARLIRRGVTWGRDLGGMTPAERTALGLPAVPGT
jgi:hypothetical protein